MAGKAAQTVIVIGGNGYVGSRMCEQAILSGMNVVSISRSGACPGWLKSSDWAQKVKWSKGDALDIDSMRPYFSSDVRAVISCVGCFHWKPSVMWAINGDTNINACDLAKESNIPRFVFVAAWRPWLIFDPVPSWNPISWIGRQILVPGYFGGKKKTEEVVETNYGDNGVCFRAGMVAGKRYISDSFALPVGFPKFMSWLIPSVPVDDLAKAAIRFVQSDIPNSDSHIVQNDDIANFYA